MRADRKAKLDKIGFVYKLTQGTFEESWNKHYQELLHFRAHNGHCQIPNVREYGSLRAWLYDQRRRYCNDQEAFPERRFVLLNELGIEWEVKEVRSWTASFNELEAFHAKHGHCKVPKTGQWTSLRRWIYGNKCRRDGPYGNQHQLTQEQVDKLNGLGLDWNINKQRSWDESYELLKAFHAKKGHCYVPSYGPTERLHTWLSMQKKAFHDSYGAKPQLKPEQVAKLQRLGVISRVQQAGRENPSIVCNVHIIQPDWQTVPIGMDVLKRDATFVDARQMISGSMLHPEVKWNFWIAGSGATEGMLEQKEELDMGNLWRFYVDRIQPKSKEAIICNRLQLLVLPVREPVAVVAV